MTEKRVTILGMGLTAVDYFNGARNMGKDGQGNDLQYANAGPLLGEIWGINLMGVFMGCDRIIQMNDATKWTQIYGRHLIERFKKFPGPILTAHRNDEFPNTVDYPLAAVMKSVGVPYINNSVAAAICLAVHEGFKEIHMYGCDFSYPQPELQAYREEGRACVEFWMSHAMSKGVHFVLPPGCTLLDVHNGQVMYGYFKPAREVLAEVGLIPLPAPPAQPAPPANITPIARAAE